MANDRMYIRCKGCGDLHYLAKCYDDGYFTTHEGEELRQGLDDFFDRHKWCYRDKYYGGFELVYESDEDAESDDERIRKELVAFFKGMQDSDWHEKYWHDLEIDRILAYLEKQKEQKPVSISCGHENDAEWSEEDEKKITFLERLIRYNVPEGQYGWADGHKSGFITKSEAISKLKSLRPSWKPSKEQMAALEAATVRYQSTGLESLYEDLKKL